MEYIFLTMILLVYVADDVKGYQHARISKRSGKPPQDKCGTLSVENGDVDQTGGTASVTCNNGYKLQIPTDMFICTHVKGHIYEWNPTPACIAEVSTATESTVSLSNTTIDVTMRTTAEVSTATESTVSLSNTTVDVTMRTTAEVSTATESTVSLSNTTVE
ncbi:uncharacterized protein LOC128556633 [Mercenaria mercenaria]|uniref:uncharacterized protein LOC128556633 n=1 Tax=Mercenaria mercenaria TaxID=6596 RepID=UPI00234EB8C8|nr:uncharacterized protein LOC128556633 [Mercenaria mercenaria]